MHRRNFLSCLVGVALLGMVVGWIVVWQKLVLANATIAQAMREAETTALKLRQAQAERDQLRSAAPSLSNAEQLELARLRSEVTRLRQEQRTATNAVTTPRAIPTSVAPTAVPAPVADVVTFTNSVSATLPLGHALVVGGWEQPGTGKRILGFVTPETSPDAPGQVLVQTRLMSVPDALLDRLGLQALRTEAAAGPPPSFDAAQFATLLKAMEQTDGVDVLSMPRVITQSGRPAQVAVQSGREGGPATGPVVDITPTLDAAGTAVRLDVGMELKLATPKSP